MCETNQNLKENTISVEREKRKKWKQNLEKYQSYFTICILPQRTKKTYTWAQTAPEKSLSDNIFTCSYQVNYLGILMDEFRSHKQYFFLNKGMSKILISL